MMKYLYKWIPFLIVLLLCGCSYNDYTKTILLPAQNQDSSAQKESSDGDWELKKMYQYQYTSANTSGWNDNLHTSVGWSGEDRTLYTLHGGSGEQVTVNKVDIRYGFYEQCADLGVLNYNHMEISPDGKYVLYDSSDTELSLIRLFLYSISDQTTQTIAEIPDLQSVFSFRFVWSGDSTCFYYWSTLNRVLVEQLKKESMDSFNMELLASYYSMLYGKDDNSVYSYDLASGKISSIYSIPFEDLFSTDTFYTFEKELFPSFDGSKLLIASGGDIAPVVYDKATGKVQKIPEEIFYEFGVSPQEFSYYGITDSMIYTQNNNYEFIMFITEENGSYTISDYMATAAYNSPKLSRGQFLISNDEKHMVDVETNENGESVIFVYSYTREQQTTISNRQLLYQTTDNITDVSITPDDQYIILKTEQELSKEEVYNNIASASTDEELNFKGAMKESRTYSQSYHYKITVLEL